MARPGAMNPIQHMKEHSAIVYSDDHGLTSRRRDCHSAAPPSIFTRCFNMGGEGGSVK